MRITSADVHPMRYMRTRPFARKAVQTFVRGPGRGLPTMETFQAVQQIIVSSYNEAMERFPLERRPERPTSMVGQEGSLACHVGMFAAAGRNVFLLAPKLMTMLDRTDLAAVRAGDVHLPFTAFYVSFGDAFDGALPGPPNRIDGAYVSQPAPGHLQVLVTSRRLDTRPDTAARWPFSRDLYFYGPFDTTDPEMGFDAILDAAVGRDITIDPSITAPDPDMVLRLSDGRQALVQDVRGLTAGEQAAYNREGLPSFRRALALVINALCYLGSGEPEIDEPAYPDDVPADAVGAVASGRRSQQDRARARLLDEGFVPVRIVGRSVASEPSDSGEPSGRSVSAHWRRGHWRRQPVGVGRASIRLTWVRPALVRGERGAPEVGHLYTVE